MNGQNTRALRRCLFGPAATGACLTLALVCGATQVQAQGNNQNLAGTHTIIINESFTPRPTRSIRLPPSAGSFSMATGIAR